MRGDAHLVTRFGKEVEVLWAALFGARFIAPGAQEKRAWHIVVREGQECVELALKGLLRAIGLEPPKLHDIGPFLLKHRERILRGHARLDLEKLARISHWLRRERERSFDGDVDFIPEGQYTREVAERAISDTIFAVEQAESALRTG